MHCAEISPSFVSPKMMLRKRTRVHAEASASRVKVWEFPAELTAARLILREKRFLAHCELDNGEKITAHCPNPGAMIGFGLDTSPQVVLSKSNDAKRKLPWTLEMVDVNGVWVGCNTMLPNRVVAAALARRAFPDLQGYTSVRPEVKYGVENSRVDFVLDYKDGSSLFLEVKNVTLKEFDRSQLPAATFPDCKTVRGQKHLRELAEVAQKSNSAAAILYYINRTDVSVFRPSTLDPTYYKLFYEAVASGMRPLPYVFETDPTYREVRLLPELLSVLPEEEQPTKTRKSKTQKSTK